MHAASHLLPAHVLGKRSKCCVSVDAMAQRVRGWALCRGSIGATLGSMPTVDHEHHDLTFRVAVIGGASDVFTSALKLKDGELSTADVQGWHPHFTFEAFPLDPWAGDGASGARLEEIVGYLDALVLTDANEEGTHYSSSAVERLSRLLGPTKLALPSTIFGGPALAQEWETLANKAPLLVVDPEPENAKEIVKALAKALLRSRMKSTPPPPPATRY